MINSRSHHLLPKAAKLPATFALILVAFSLSGCEPFLGGATTKFDKVGAGEAPVVIGPPVRDNYTPMNQALACLAHQIEVTGKPKLTIAVDDIKDYTGQYNINQGDAITQGGSLMVMSALGKLGGTVNVADRFNTDVAQMELSFMNQRELGDGQQHVVGDGPQAKKVPWIPYYGGSIIDSQYYITGGITELNYNIQSGGVQFQVNELGPKDRVYTEDVGIDLELVDSRSLLVVKSVSLVKQLTGYEVGFNIFQFFGSNLYNLNIGNKSQEPEQLGVRTLLEEGVLRLVSYAEGLAPEPCLSTATGWISKETAEQYLAADRNGGKIPAPLPSSVVPPVADATPAAPPPAPVPAPVVTPAVAVATPPAAVAAPVAKPEEAAPVAVATPVAAPAAATPAAPVSPVLAADSAGIAVPTPGAPAMAAKPVAVATPAPAPMAAPVPAAAADNGVAVPVPVVVPAPVPASSNVSTTAAGAASTLNSQTSSAPLQNGLMQKASGQSEIKFDYGAADVNGGDMAELDQAASVARQHPVQVVLLAPANESWAPTKRAQLLAARVASVKKALEIRGILHVNVAWTPDPTAGGAVIDSSGGGQKIALLVITP